MRVILDERSSKPLHGAKWSPQVVRNGARKRLELRIGLAQLARALSHSFFELGGQFRELLIGALQALAATLQRVLRRFSGSDVVVRLENRLHACSVTIQGPGRER